MVKLPQQNEPLTFPRHEDHNDVPNKKIIRDIGLKVTLQRLGILDTVRGGPAHFTAQEVYEKVITTHPDIGFATVYRFLKKLSEHNYISEFRIGGMPARYEWITKNHHDHMSCTQCGKIIEFENDKIEKLQESIAEEYGFKLTSHILELYGICLECSKKNQ